MPVIINDFEIVAESSAGADARSAQPAPAAPSESGRLRPVDVERIVAHLQARRLRIYAD